MRSSEWPGFEARPLADGASAGHSGTGGQAGGPPLVRVLVHSCGQPVAIFLHYAGSDGYNFDAHNESFAWLAALKGIPVTIQSDPPADHNLRYFRRNHRPAFTWLAEHLPSPTCARWSR